MTFAPQPKPEKRVTTKRRESRVATLVVQQVRAKCVERDGDCRYAKDFGFTTMCRGQSEWCHFGKYRRARTRGMSPAERHNSAGSLILCSRHHTLYDAGRLLIHAETGAGCNGPLSFSQKDDQW